MAEPSLPHAELIDGTIRAGVWHGIVHASAPDAPAIEIRHAGGTLQPRLFERIAGQADRWRGRDDGERGRTA